jgi:hypothetical protein
MWRSIHTLHINTALYKQTHRHMHIDTLMVILCQCWNDFSCVYVCMCVSETETVYANVQYSTGKCPNLNWTHLWR